MYDLISVIHHYCILESSNTSYITLMEMSHITSDMLLPAFKRHRTQASLRYSSLLRRTTVSIYRAGEHP